MKTVKKYLTSERSPGVVMPDLESSIWTNKESNNGTSQQQIATQIVGASTLLRLLLRRPVFIGVVVN